MLKSLLSRKLPDDLPTLEWFICPTFKWCIKSTYYGEFMPLIFTKTL